MRPEIPRQFHASPVLSFHRTDLIVCPSVLLLGFAMLLRVKGPLMLIEMTILMGLYLALWLGKLWAQVWLARRLGLDVLQTQLTAFVTQIMLAPRGKANAQRDVYLLGLAVLFGVWAAASLIAGQIDGMSARWLMLRLAEVALIGGLVALVPFFGLEGAQLLRLRVMDPAVQANVGLIGQWLTGVWAVAHGVMSLWLLSESRLDGAVLYLVLTWVGVRLWMMADRYRAAAL
jgi:hypothetical protein